MVKELRDFNEKIDKFFMENSKEHIEELLKPFDDMEFEGPTAKDYLNYVYYEDIRREKKLLREYKRRLRGLINVTGLFRYLGQNDYWYPEDIVDIELTDETRSGYSTYQHARIVGDTYRRLYMKTPDDEIRGIDHYYVWQTTGCCEDDYSGWMLFPLKNGKYFKVHYNC
jgi:hypothetical protein